MYGRYGAIAMLPTGDCLVTDIDKRVKLVRNDGTVATVAGFGGELTLLPLCIRRRD
jgi:hypothetical protein